MYIQPPPPTGVEPGGGVGRGEPYGRGRDSALRAPGQLGPA